MPCGRRFTSVANQNVSCTKPYLLDSAAVYTTAVASNLSTWHSTFFGSSFVPPHETLRRLTRSKLARLLNPIAYAVTQFKVI